MTTNLMRPAGGPVCANCGAAGSVFVATCGWVPGNDDRLYCQPGHRPTEDLPATPGERAMRTAYDQLRAAEEVLDAAVRLRVTELVGKAFPTAAQLHAYGAYQEDGLLHLRTQLVADAEGNVLFDVEEVDPLDEDAASFTNEIDSLLDEIAERDDTYQGDVVLDLRPGEAATSEASPVEGGARR